MKTCKVTVIRDRKITSCGQLMLDDQLRCSICTAAGVWETPESPIPSRITSDPVNHPPHYTSHPSGVECIQITRHMNFNLGNVLKYIWRTGLKDEQIEDLKKARWYLDDEIKRLESVGKT